MTTNLLLFGHYNFYIDQRVFYDFLGEAILPGLFFRDPRKNIKEK